MERPARGKINTLNEFRVEWTHVDMEKKQAQSDFDHYLLKLMCENASKGVEMQCGREYWKEQVEDPRATQIHHNLTD